MNLNLSTQQRATVHRPNFRAGRQGATSIPSIRSVYCPLRLLRIRI